MCDGQYWSRQKNLWTLKCLPWPRRSPLLPRRSPWCCSRPRQASPTESTVDCSQEMVHKDHNNWKIKVFSCLVDFTLIWKTVMVSYESYLSWKLAKNGTESSEQKWNTGQGKIKGMCLSNVCTSEGWEGRSQAGCQQSLVRWLPLEDAGLWSAEWELSTSFSPFLPKTINWSMHNFKRQIEDPFIVVLTLPTVWLASP